MAPAMTLPPTRSARSRNRAPPAPRPSPTAALKAVIFPAVDAGSTVHLRFHKTVSKSVIPGQFDYFVEPARGPVQSQTLVFDLPEDKPLYADARGYKALSPVTHNGRTRYEFAYSTLHYDRVEAGAVGYVQFGDRLMVSTFFDYKSFAASYRDGAIDPTANDPAIRNLAESLTRNNATSREKAATLYDWVRHNIRYVSLYLGQSPAVPHKASQILANRYGDCKDYVALYGALLSAAGIENEPALVALGSVYTLPSVPGYGASAINHIITWLPGLNMYADATASAVEFGYLPLAEMDRPALLVGDGTLTRTPPTQPLSRDVRLQIAVAPDGSAAFSSQVEDGGWSAGPERAILRHAAPQRRQQIRRCPSACDRAARRCEPDGKRPGCHRHACHHGQYAARSMTSCGQPEPRHYRRSRVCRAASHRKSRTCLPNAFARNRSCALAATSTKSRN